MQYLKRRNRPAPPPSPANSPALEKVKGSSEKNRNFLIALVGLLVYVAVTVSSTEDLSFLLPEAKLRLPLLGVDVPLKLFYLATPLFVVAIHADLLLNLVAHHAKLIAWRKSTARIGVAQIEPFMFDFATLVEVNSTSETIHKRTFSVLTRLYSALLAYWLCPAVILLTAWWFTSYQSWQISSYHALLLLIDLTLIVWAKSATSREREEALGVLNQPKRLPEHIALTMGIASFSVAAIALPAALLALETDAGRQWWLDQENNVRSGSDVHVEKSVIEGSSTASVKAYDPSAEEGSDTIDGGWSTNTGGNRGYGTTIMYTDGIRWTSISPEYGTWATTIPKSLNLIDASFSWLAKHLPLRIDVAHVPELRRVPTEAIKLRQLETSLSEKEAWHEFGVQSRSISLSDRRLRFANFSGAQLAYADLRGAKLDGANVTGANLSHAKLDGTSFIGASGANARFHGVRGQSSDFSHADLQSSEWYGAEISRSRFVGSKLDSATFLGGLFSNGNFSASSMAGSKLIGVNLYGATFDSANLQGSYFNQSSIASASFQRTNLYRVKFHFVDASDAKLSLAMLQASQWHGARGVTFTNESNPLGYATPGKVFRTRFDLYGLSQTLVVHARQTARIDLRELHDVNTCNDPTSTGKKKMLFRSYGQQILDSAVFGNCPNNQQSREGNFSPNYSPNRALYENLLATNMCQLPKNSGRHDNSHDAIAADKQMLLTLAELSKIYVSSDLKNGTYKTPNFDSKPFAERLKKPECRSLRHHLYASVPSWYDTQLHRWLAEGGFNRRSAEVLLLG